MASHPEGDEDEVHRLVVRDDRQPGVDYGDIDKGPEKKIYSESLHFPKKYSLWYGHSGMDISTEKTHSYTEEEIHTLLGQNVITDMKIEGDLPANIGQLAPDVTNLCVRDVDNEQCLNSLSQLTKLTKLDISGNPLHSIPKDVFSSLTSLTELDMSNCQLSSLPESLSLPTKLTKLDISWNPLHSIPKDAFSLLTSLTELDMSYCQLSSLPESLCSLSLPTKLNKLYITGNLLHSIPKDVFSSLTSLTELDMADCELSSLHESMSKLVNLEALNISGNNFSSDGLPEIFTSMDRLRKLDIQDCELSALPLSMSKLVRLEVLNISHNKFSSAGLPEIFTSMDQLRELDIRDSELSALPLSLSQLTKLNKLNISWNPLHSIPKDVVSSLISLTELDMSNIQLSSLPESLSLLTKLTKLNLSRNPLHSVPADVFFLLTSLSALNMTNCQLSSLPESLSTLPNLQELDICGNLITHLPEHIARLQSLQSLILDYCKQLKSLTPEILNMPKLTNISVADCRSLSSPPYEVCTQGVDAIRQYYVDIEPSSSVLAPIATIAVIGESMSGKTSLIKTLQSTVGERVLVKREPDAVCDETTKVFEMEEVEVEDATLQFIDFGGNEVYQSTYQLILKQNCTAAVIVNVEQYKELEEEIGGNEAVRKLFFNWLSHLYLANPDFGAPKLVLTHMDKLDESSFEELKERLIYHTKTVSAITTVALEEDNGTESSSRFQKKIVFEPSDIYCIGNTYTEIFDQIKSSLLNESQAILKQVPKLWKNVDSSLQSLQHGFNTFDKIFGIMSKKHLVNRQQLDVILTYMHNCGKLLWYKEMKGLKSYIFHLIPVVAELLHVLFTHDKNVWRGRLANIAGAPSENCNLLDETEFRKLSDQFQTTGMINWKLLHHLLLTETKFSGEREIKVALDILESFRFLHGPTTVGGESYYVVPYFCTDFLPDSINCSDTDISLRVELKFEGLALPQYVYHQLSLELLASNSANMDPTIKNNGIKMFIANNIVVQLTHDFKSRKLSIQVTTKAKQIFEAWEAFSEVTNSTIRFICTTWKSSRIKCTFICPHCLLKGDSHPQRTINPQWCDLPGRKKIINQISRKDMEALMCKSDLDVPGCLKYPSVRLSEEQLKLLNDYIQKIKPGPLLKRSGPSDTLRAPPESKYPRLDRDRQLSPLSDAEGFPSSAKPALSYLPLVPTTLTRIRDLFMNTGEVYPMSTPIRGRALVINIQSFADMRERKGSDVDQLNLVNLLMSLQFDVVQKHDLTAEAIYTTIETETEHDDHIDYGMFMLVLMSYGSEEGVVYGSDGKGLKLKHVYDSMSPQNFSHMSGKPKVLIIQASSGALHDYSGQGREVPVTKLSSEATIDLFVPDIKTELGKPKAKMGLNVDDLVILKSSFESYNGSIRHVTLGSLFTRTLVSTLYTHSCHRDVVELFDIVRERVRQASIDLAEKYPNVAYGQMPTLMHTLTSRRKLYLFPGYNGEK